MQRVVAQRKKREQRSVIFPQDNSIGSITLDPAGPFVTGERVTLTITFTAGAAGLEAGARLRVGLPNTGWQAPVVPQHRYWDDLVVGKDRRYAPFHPVNTTVTVQTGGKASVALATMERMLLPDEDPAEAYWRWWITATLEDAPLFEGDTITFTYGDPRFTGEQTRIQTFPENGLTLSAYVDRGDGLWIRPAGAPIQLDVISGPPVRANVVVPSVMGKATNPLRIALTDACHCKPQPGAVEALVLRDEQWRRVGTATRATDGHMVVDLKRRDALIGRITVTDKSGQKTWGRSNPWMLGNDEGRCLFWGDLHAQSEYHVMHSQKKDARQVEWAKGISCGTPEEVYRYARDVSLLDFVAITDQGAITGVGWELLKQNAAQYYNPGEFVTFNAYEAGSPVGHRNVLFRDGTSEPSEQAAGFSYMPEFLYKYYEGRKDVMMIPHHVKTWTDWRYYDPDLEPVMEVYSCWGQSENPSLERWDKGMTPGAGAWEALRRGYRLGMIASSDNHVGMPGRSYPHDRQVHTPFPGGLAAVWATELTREAIFDAIHARRCYGTTGARIILEFLVNDHDMGEELRIDDKTAPRKIQVYVRGTDSIAQIEILRNGSVVHVETPDLRKDRETVNLEWEDNTALEDSAFYYVRVRQGDGEMAWSSPIWVDAGLLLIPGGRRDRS